MSEAVIKVRDNGPLKVTGPATITDVTGAVIEQLAEGQTASLCRCGASEDKPYCDDSHLRIGFKSQVRQAERQAAAQSSGNQEVKS